MKLMGSDVVHNRIQTMKKEVWLVLIALCGIWIPVETIEMLKIRKILRQCSGDIFWGEGTCIDCSVFYAECETWRLVGCCDYCRCMDGGTMLLGVDAVLAGKCVTNSSRYPAILSKTGTCKYSLYKSGNQVACVDFKDLYHPYFVDMIAVNGVGAGLSTPGCFLKMLEIWSYGSWTSPVHSFENSFYIHDYNGIQSLYWRPSGDMSLSGNLIRLELSCEADKSSSCLMLKVAGESTGDSTSAPGTNPTNSIASFVPPKVQPTNYHKYSIDGSTTAVNDSRSTVAAATTPSEEVPVTTLIAVGAASLAVIVIIVVATVTCKNARKRRMKSASDATIQGSQTTEGREASSSFYSDNIYSAVVDQPQQKRHENLDDGYESLRLHEVSTEYHPLDVRKLSSGAILLPKNMPTVSPPRAMTRGPLPVFKIHDSNDETSAYPPSFYVPGRVAVIGSSRVNHRSKTTSTDSRIYAEPQLQKVYDWPSDKKSPVYTKVRRVLTPVEGRKTAPEPLYRELEEEC